MGCLESGLRGERAGEASDAVGRSVVFATLCCYRSAAGATAQCELVVLLGMAGAAPGLAVVRCLSTGSDAMKRKTGRFVPIEMG